MKQQDLIQAKNGKAFDKVHGDVYVAMSEIQAWIDVMIDLGVYRRTFTNRSQYQIIGETEHGVGFSINLTGIGVRSHGLVYAHDNIDFLRFSEYVNGNYSSFGKGARGRQHAEDMQEIFSYLFDLGDRGYNIVG